MIRRPLALSLIRQAAQPAVSENIIILQAEAGSSVQSRIYIGGTTKDEVLRQLAEGKQILVSSKNIGDVVYYEIIAENENPVIYITSTIVKKCSSTTDNGKMIFA